MRFKTYISKTGHSDLTSCIGWLSSEEVVTCGDDHKLFFWNTTTHEIIRTVNLPDDIYPTDLSVYPKWTITSTSSSSSSSRHRTSDLFAVSSSNGKYHIFNRTGKLERSIEAHKGAVITIEWSHDGTALASGGEEGQVKIWSKSGMLRSTLSAHPAPVYSLAWSPLSDAIIYTIESSLEIKSLSPKIKPILWKAHDGVILKVTWNQCNNTIVSGGEDCRYKVWDYLGRLLFTSSINDYPITSLAWSSDGTLFAVGSFNCLKLCDQHGWAYSLNKPSVQSIYNLSWSTDSTQIAGSTGKGSVVFAHVIERQIDWSNYEIRGLSQRLLRVRDIAGNTEEDLDFRDNIIKFSLEHGHLIVITTNQCCIYRATSNFTAPTSFDLKESNISCVLQSTSGFVLVDSTSVNFYSYDGRPLANLKWIGCRVDFLNRLTFSLSSDTLAAIDANDNKSIHFIDLSTGKPFTSNANYKHKSELIAVSLNQTGPMSERKSAFIDKNCDLYLTLVRPSGSSVPGSIVSTIKFHSMITWTLWNDSADILAGLGENGRINIWLYPQASFVDKELLSLAIIEKDPIEANSSRNLQLIGFHGNQLKLRLSDGSPVQYSLSPFPRILYSYIGSAKWPEALKLCRYLKSSADSSALWATLAGMALSGRNLEVAEQAYAAIDKVDKVLYIQKVQRLSDSLARNAEIALICGNIKEAESILIAGKFILKAILVNLEIYNWDRAIELMEKFDSKKRNYAPVICLYRQRYLERFDKTEENKKFKKLFDEINYEDWNTIEEMIKDPYKHKLD